MAYTSVDRRRVYLACRPIFTGQNAQLRRQKKIKELVESRRKSLDPLLRTFGLQKVVDILRVLLDDRIFESELKAKVEFPELFLSSPERDTQRAESEIYAAQSAAEALEEIASIDELENEQEEDDQYFQELAVSTEEVLRRIALPTFDASLISPFQDIAPTSSNKGGAPSLYPSYLPYATQHIVLTTTQRIIEECCFDFVKRWLPSILDENGWDCAAAVELTKWTRLLAKRAGKLPNHALSLNGTTFNEVLFSTHKLRHSAVHRLSTTARGVNQLIEAALKLTVALQDHVRAAQLEELYSEIDSKIKAMELNKNALEDEFASALQEINRQRQELDEKERQMRANMISGDLGNKLLIGSLLEDSVRKIFAEGVESQTAGETDGDELDDQKDIELDGLGDSLTEVSNHSALGTSE